ncbi:YqgQ family protein [Halobacillus yeomjeoni]|uniref:YqgQ family protein n=1 Tax=Halobacillus yeomjeoni TaxID=311194 RepID=A0A931HVF8_9BACI|nr:YqgQ family protein [Halobacillus yeomjeoni]MBH0229871.1 YqgQ family protein [Halobacillus yeomjeoni]
MKTIYDVQQLLKKFGTFIYIGDRLADLEMMEDEIRELHRSQCVTNEEFQMAILLLRSEIAKLREKEKGEEL